MSFLRLAHQKSIQQRDGLVSGAQPEGRSRFLSGNDNKREEVQREREDWEIPILHTGESEFRFATRRENRVSFAPLATGKTAQDGN